MRLRDNVSPRILCRQHLLGEHSEYHKIFEPSIIKLKPMTGYLEVKAVSFLSFFRHNELVREMIRRGYNHKSPIKIRSIQALYYGLKFNFPMETYERENLKMLLQGYTTKAGVYKPGCKACQERYIKYLKGCES